MSIRLFFTTNLLRLEGHKTRLRFKGDFFPGWLGFGFDKSDEASQWRAEMPGKYSRAVFMSMDFFDLAVIFATEA